MSRSWNFTMSAPASTDRSTSCLASDTSPWWLMPISEISTRRCVGGDHVAADAELVGAVDRDGDEVAALVDEGDVVDPGAEGVRDLGGAAADRQAARRGVGGLEGRYVDGEAGGAADPAAEVAVGQHAVEVAVRVDEEDDPRLVGGDLLQGAQDRVAGVDDVGREVTLDDQRRGLPWVSVRLNRNEGRAASRGHTWRNVPSTTARRAPRRARCRCRCPRPRPSRRGRSARRAGCRAARRSRCG